MKQFCYIVFIFFTGCLKQSEPVTSEKMIFFHSTLDSVYDIELQNDTLYTANGVMGIKVFKVFTDGEVKIDSLYEGIAFSDEEDIISIELSTDSGILFALDKFNFTYAIKKAALFDPGLSFYKGISDCSRYQSKSTIVKHTSPTEILTLYRKIDQFDEDNRSTSVGKISFSDLVFYPAEECVDDLLIDLNYGLSDLDFFNDRLYLSNANNSIPSIQVYNKNENVFTFVFEDTLTVIPNTISVYENAYAVGLDNKGGCYIALLDIDGTIEDNFTIANGFTIRDIHLSSGLLVLSAGYDGVLVYEWFGNGNTPTPKVMISTGYAYSALVYDNNKIIVGTKNGIEVFEI